MSVVELGPVVKSIEVRRTPEEAFRLFTQEISAWWPMKKHSRAKDAAGEITVRVDFEQHVGGRIYETLNTGEQREWGEVIALEPGKRVQFSFSMGRPRDKSGEVEVRFEPLGRDTCLVTLVHTHWERFGNEAEAMRRGFANGWDAVFIESFGKFAGPV
ncbi:MAG: SRPBCC domain-containing protein [Hyphomicrobiaceae bacterium]